jgi:gliding motility-associated protein GldM
MAHERLSPRQKMIGMMYLVLTAMLALNVSKEAVEAFKKVDKGLTKTIANYVSKNAAIYEDFDKAFAQNPAKAGPYKDKAVMIRQRADELFNYIQDIKIEIINTAEKPGNPAVKGKEIEIEEVKKIDENNIPSQILIGANFNGKAFALKTLLANFRDDMIKDVIAGKAPTIEESLKSIFNTDDGLDKSGEKERWETLNFQALPLVAVITLLSKTQVDVRNAETDLITFLYGQIDKKSFKFNKIVPIVKPISSTYVMQGNEYQAEVFLSAIDTTQAPIITVGEYTTTTNADGTKKYEMAGSNYMTLPIDEQTGRGVFKVRGSSIGPKPWGGLISMKSPSGEIVTQPFKDAYVVGANSVLVSATAMNVLYYGIDNPIDISVPGIGPDKISAVMVNGSITKGQVKASNGEIFNGSWIAKPTVEGKMAQIIVSADMNGTGKFTQVGVAPFRVKPVPPPVAEFANVQQGKVPRNLIIAQQGVFAVMKDFDFPLNYTVTEFKIGYFDKGFFNQQASTSNRITDKQREMLNNITRGTKLLIEDIKAVGPDKKIVQLNSVVIEVN